MADKKSDKRDRVTFSVIADLVGVNATLERIAEAQRNLDLIRIKLDHDIAKLKTEAVAEAEKLTTDLLTHSLSVAEFAERNRSDLVKEEKSVKLPAGIFGWRNNPPSVSLKDAKRVIEICEKRKLEDFLRRKVEVNKAGMLANPELAESVTGVTIKTGEELFFVKTNEAEVCVDSQKQKFIKPKKGDDQEDE